MKVGYLSLSLLPLFACCTNEEKRVLQSPMAQDVKFSQPVNATAFACLEENVKFLEKKPTAIKEFVINIGKASTKCTASEDTLTEYVKSILDKHGDAL